MTSSSTHSQRRIQAPRVARLLRRATAGVSSSLLPLMVAAAGGCAQRDSTFIITDFRNSGDAHRFMETFDEAYYTIDNHGNVDVVFRRETPSAAAPGHTITQLIHLKTVWRSRPGQTVAHRTQINGTVRYRILAGSARDSFEGAGSIFFSENRDRNELTGTLEDASLRPRRRASAGHDLFHRARLEGEFHALRDRRRVVRLVLEMDRSFEMGAGDG